MHLNPFAISGLSNTFIYLPLVLFIFIKGKSKIARIFSLHIFSALIWSIGAFLIGTTKNEKIAYQAMNFSYIGVIFIPVFLAHAIQLLIGKQNRPFLYFIYSQAIFFTAITLLGLLTPKIEWRFNSFYWYTYTHWILLSFVLFVLIATIAHYQLFTYYKKHSTETMEDVIFLSMSALGFIGGISNWLPTFGLNFYPYGNFLISINSIFITYVALKHQVVEINFVIKRTIFYSIILALLSIVYFIAVFLSEKIVQGYFGYKSFILSILIAFLIGIVFIPLRNRIQRLIDTLFFHKSPAEIEEENKKLLKEVEQTERLKTIATLATGVAHEIKNPLTAINTFSEQLPKRLNDKEFLAKFSRIVGHEVTRINDLVHDLLAFAKPAPAHLQDTDIYKLIDSTLELLNNAFVKYNITVRQEHGDVRNLVMKIDEKQIRQALMNIFLNAIEAMTSGGQLTVTTRILGLEDLRIKGKNSNNTQVLNSSIPQILEVSISDTGPGISTKDLPYIFDPFFSTKDQGTGLGLSVTQGIIQNHGGKLYARNNPDGGAEFVMELPITTDKL
ncbi:MAG: hypothetical protein A3D10_04200 [Omnitrophica WOR_2 bacterium RIFCSPHIGHO2_02_FULL_48_11]|nr:MAG: hypothetical protein A3D10_04200 [Omnitrophica WOR_2 bacterium RIFCSPHIGHO2_02_FULL_48_11]